VLTTVRSPVRQWRPWRGGAWSRQGCLPMVRTTQRRCRRDPWEASGALSARVQGEARRRAMAERWLHNGSDARAVWANGAGPTPGERGAGLKWRAACSGFRSATARGSAISRPTPGVPHAALDLCCRSAMTDWIISEIAIQLSNDRLTEQVRRWFAPNPWRFSGGIEHQSCRPTFPLQTLFKDQHLKRRGSEVTWSQSGLDATEMQFKT